MWLAKATNKIESRNLYAIAAVDFSHAATDSQASSFRFYICGQILIHNVINW